MLINIIHPYTYKLVGDTLNMGPVSEYTERDLGVAVVVNTALDKGAKVLLHRYHDGDQFKAMLEQAALALDPLYGFIFDPRITSVVTTPFGTPRPNAKPEPISAETWRAVEKMYTSDSELEQHFIDVNPIIFIGGVLERCVTNIACYAHQKYKKPGQELFYIPELCVSLDRELLQKTTLPEFAKRDIKPLTVEQFRRRLL